MINLELALFLFLLGEVGVVLFCFETGTQYVAQVGFKLAFLLPQPPEHWDVSYRGLTSASLCFCFL